MSRIDNDTPMRVETAQLWPALAAAALALAGCGGAAARAELGLARDSVQTALEAWKRGETAESLKSRDPAIEFHDDDWQSSARLIDFQIERAYRDTDGGPRCAVAVTVQQDGEAAKQIKVTYQINTKPKIVIARDPMS